MSPTQMCRSHAMSRNNSTALLWCRATVSVNCTRIFTTLKSSARQQYTHDDKHSIHGNDYHAQELNQPLIRAYSNLLLTYKPLSQPATSHRTSSDFTTLSNFCLTFTVCAFCECILSMPLLKQWLFCMNEALCAVCSLTLKSYMYLLRLTNT